MKCAVCLLISGLLVLLSSGSGLCQDPTVKVFVSILPQKYLVQRIAGDLARTDVFVSPGKNPATYSPTPDQVRQLAQAHVFFRIGVPFENGFLHKIKSIAQDITMVDCRRGITLRDMEAHVHDDEDHGAHHNEKGHDEDHGHGEHHSDKHHDEDHNEKNHDDEQGHGGSHSGKDPHIWMSPVLMKTQADTILKTLAQIDPTHAAIYKKNHQALVRDLSDLHAKLVDILKPFSGEALFVFHPAFGYFADAYNMRQVPVESMGKAPKGKNLAAFINLAKKEKARVIFVQPQFDRHAAQKIAQAIKGHVVAINPLAYNYIANMETVAQTIIDHLKH